MPKKAKADPRVSVDSFGLAFGSVRFARFVERLGGGELIPVAPIAHSLNAYGNPERVLNGLIETGLVSVLSRKGEKFLEITDAGRLALIVFYTGG